MSGFFRGPSLFWHVFIAAAGAGVAAPFLAERIGTGKAVLACLAAVFCYGVIAFILSIPRKR